MNLEQELKETIPEEFRRGGELITVDGRAVFDMILGIQDAYTHDVKHWIEYLKSTGQGITYESMKAYRQYLNDSGIPKRTANKRLIAMKSRIRHIFKSDPGRFDVRTQYVMNEALGELKTFRVDKTADGSRFLTESEIRVLLQSSTERVALILGFVYEHGLRISEALGIRLADIKANGRGYNIRIQGKGGKERRILARFDTGDRIREFFQGQTWLFETRNGTQLSRNWVSNTMKRTAKKALGRNVSAHDLRHSFVTNCYQAGQPLEKISRYVGHSSIAITHDIYLHVDGLDYDDLPNIVSSVPSSIQGVKP